MHYKYFLEMLKKDLNIIKPTKHEKNKLYSIVFKEYYKKFLDTNMIIKNNNSIEMELNYSLVPSSRPRVTKFSSFYAQPYRGFKEFFFNAVESWVIENNMQMLNYYDKAVSIKIIEYRKFLVKDSKVSNIKNNFDSMFLAPNLDTPDNDNILKTVLDAFNKNLFIDDKVVFISKVEKYTSFKDYTKIIIRYNDNIIND